MISSQFDVAIVGAGCAGLTAALGLAKAGFRVVVVEAAAYPGAENWSGCVYFCENLADPAILGPDGVEQLAWERRLVERGFFASDGHSLLGMKYRDPEAFRHCYTVLRPIFDHHLGQIARKHGVTVLTETTAESLIRENRRVVGIATNRGPLYADLVYLAEGDASHLVTKEGYERFSDPRDAPKFLQGIKQVWDMPLGEIEKIFGVQGEEGVAYEVLLRNGTLRGKNVHLNMGGFVYTNRQSLSIGLVLPADNLHEHFDGDPNMLMEWFEELPALQPWLKTGRRGVFGAKIIRGGGAKDIPTLIDDGLAIGGAASAIGIDFPYPNFTGPATAMGLLLTQAAQRIRADGGRYTREELRRHYLEPLQRTHYWQDVEFLRHWPGYVKKTQVFFDRNIDLALGTAYIWSRPDSWLLTRWSHWLRLVLHLIYTGDMQGIQRDMRHLVRALRLREATAERPALGRLLLDGTLNALRDLVGAKRAGLDSAGTLRLHYSIGGDTEPAGAAPRFLQRWFQRFSSVLAAAAREVYSNNTKPLTEKLPKTVNLLLQQINILDLLATAGFALAAAVGGGWLAVAARFLERFRQRPRDQMPRGIYPRYAAAAARAGDLTPAAAASAQEWEARLAHLSYQTVRASHIHVLWPQALQDKNKVTQAGLWHVCPAHVFEARVSPLGQVQVVVNFENCIKCETCWRTSDLVDWGRDGAHRFTYPVVSPPAVMDRLLVDVHAAGLIRPTPPHTVDPWAVEVATLEEQLRAAGTPSNGQATLLREGEAGAEPTPVGRIANPAHTPAPLAELRGLIDKLDRKLAEFDAALAEEPRTADRARAEHLEMLARYAQQLAGRLGELLRDSALGQVPPAVRERLRELAAALHAKAEERARRTWDRRFSWAAADGRQLRQHHLVGLRRFLNALQKPGFSEKPGFFDQTADPTQVWLRSETATATLAEEMAWVRNRLDEALPPGAWRDLDRGTPLSAEQDAALRAVLGRVGAIDANRLAETLHPPLRKAVLAELGRRDPSLAFRAASHLWARDLAHLHAGSAALAAAAQRWTRGEEWACFAIVEAASMPDGAWTGEALFVPACGAGRLLLLIGDQLAVVAPDAAGLRVEPLGTQGLRGAGLARLRLEQMALPETRAAADHERLRRLGSILSAADLTSIAFGMADILCQRTVAHATSRVQFPGLFHDEDARDAVGKFGAVKKMVAEMGAHRYLIETLDQVLSPLDFSTASVERAGLVKALTAEALGTSPGSLSYNAGQVFGGTGYSEDDILSMYYRDAAAWRCLAPANVDVLRQHGENLLRQWRSEGHALSGVRDEGLLFDQVAQRQALQAELDEVRVLRSRLRSLLNDWQAFRADQSSEETGGGVQPSVATVAEITERIARQDAYLLAGKALLLRTHARLEHGHESRTEKALLAVWLDGASAALEELDALIRQAMDPAATQSDRPIVEPTVSPPPAVYAGFLKAEAAYDSGDFLITPVNLGQPRLLPEMLETDPELVEADRTFQQLLAAQFGQMRDGLPYERHIERAHRPDDADIDYARKHGFFRMPIPKELGGEGRRKVDYYLLVTNLQRSTDASFCLTVQVNTGIGCAPIFLARDKELPKALKDLTPFVGDTDLQKDIQSKLERLAYLVPYGNTKRIARALQELQQRLDEGVFARGAVKALAHRFVALWPKIVQAAKEPDLKPLTALVQQATVYWKDICARAPEYHAELGRRREACELFLQWVAAGQISAFALTEPSAGSDTARVATRARLRSVALEREPGGAYRFVPEGGKEPRFLLDAKRLEFRAEEVVYRWSDSAEPAPIRFDEYDYETDDPAKMRYYDCDGRRVHFTDIAQVRERDGKLWYDYFELTGAKMWITNGRIMGVMCLYAKTEEGVTGFLVDRHAEGLVVGKDEEKMGQNGSPTNELSLQNVRVPRENMLGLEGRGQVNALEALNVGRAGLGISSMAQLAELIEKSRIVARNSSGEVPDWAAWRLERMEEDCFIAEATAWEVIGRFEHKQTRSVRMESSIAKMLNTELLLRVIEFAEEIHGLAGQTHLHTVEKRKRDARVLYIYEGTNEIQRSLILKDLAAELAPKWAKAAAAPIHVGREAVDLETLKRELRQKVQAALDVFGSGLWQNPNLQANCFLLAEAAAWVKAADSSLARLAWLERREAEPIREGEASDEPAPVGRTILSVQGERTDRIVRPTEPARHSPRPPELGCHALLARLEIGRRAFARCLREIRLRLRRFEEELAYLRRGFYAATVPAAVRMFQQGEAEAAATPLSSRIEEKLSVLVVLEPSAAEVPQPHVADGHLLETHFTLSEADRAALEIALRLRDAAPNKVLVLAAAVGPKGLGQVLRETRGLGVDRVRLVVTERDGFTPDSGAAALAEVLREEAPFDLVMTGGDSTVHEEGLLGTLTAAKLGIPTCGRAARLAVRKTAGEGVLLLADADNRPPRTRALPACVAVEPGLALRVFTTEGYLAGLADEVSAGRWPKKVRLRPARLVEGAKGSTSAEEPTRALNPPEAAGQLKQVLGLTEGSATRVLSYAGSIAEVSQPSLPDGGVTALVAADATGRLSPSAVPVVLAARLVARADAAEMAVLVVVPPEEEAQRRAISQVLDLFRGRITLLAARGVESSADVRARVLRETWPLLNGRPHAVVGEAWTEPAFAALSSTAEHAGSVVPRARAVRVEEGQVILEFSRAQGKLRSRQVMTLSPGTTWWLSLAPDAEVTAEPALTVVPPTVQRWTPRLDRFWAGDDMHRLLEELKQETGLQRLSDAEFILDVGFGVGNRDGYEEVIEPLERALRDFGVKHLAIGGSRKVTEELHLLPLDRQIGQSGVSVNPRILLAIGISGAPQHLNYIGPRATILSFNRDPDAPLMTLNQRQPRPRVFPIVGDLFETVPAFIAALGQEAAAKQYWKRRGT